MMREFSDALESLYIWDDVEKKGFPLTDAVRAIDMNNLDESERLIIAGGDSEKIQQLIEDKGGSLGKLLEMSTIIFKKIIRAVYEYESEEKKQDIQRVVRSILEIGIEDF
jgi:glutamine amidotransferase PdxT